ncbi:MAG: sarcosine oxidase subunit gamma [Cellvibrionales bacterium]|nr:sarcosine oxidase subunit gamma [Cellvibrionales bacterium]
MLNDTQHPDEKNTIKPALYALMDQCTSGDVAMESPVVHTAIANDGIQNNGIKVVEEAFLSHLVIRGNVNDQDFISAIETAASMRLPEKLQTSQGAHATIYWVSPDEWLIATNKDAFETEANLREKLSGHYALVNVSGGQTRLLLSGSNSHRLLHAASPYDFHLSNFPVGKVITTVFARAQALIHRKSIDEWELIIRRSFSDYLALWIEDFIISC